VTVQISSHLKKLAVSSRRPSSPRVRASDRGPSTTGSTARASNHRDLLEKRDGVARLQKPWNKLSPGSCRTLLVRGCDAERHRDLPRSAPEDGRPQEDRHHLGGELYEGKRAASGALTYEELHHEVVRCAGALAKLGVTKGDRVAI